MSTARPKSGSLSGDLGYALSDKLRCRLAQSNHFRYPLCYPDDLLPQRCKAMPRLSDRAVAALKAAEKRAEIPDDLVRGLWLVVQPTGAKSFAVRYRTPSNKTAKVTLGTYPRLPLADARLKAREVLMQVAVGRDPAAERRSAKTVALVTEGIEAEQPTFDVTLQAFLQRYVDQRCRPSTRSFYRSALNVHVLPFWRGRPLADIVKRDVVEAVERVNEKSPVMANRVLAVLKVFLRWAVDQDVIRVSPAADVRRPSLERSRDRVVDDDQLPLVWRAAESQGYPFGPIAQLLVLSGQRRGEVAGARWEEIDLARRLWTIPGDRTKNGETHVVPLSDGSVSIIRSLPRISGSPWVFTTTGACSVSGFSRSKRALDVLIARQLPAAADPIPAFTLHDWRRTFASGCARLGVPVHVVE